MTDTGNIHPIAGLAVLNLVDSIIYTCLVTENGNIHPIADLSPESGRFYNLHLLDDRYW